MKKKLKKNSLIRYSRQIILKNIGIIGQKKILSSKVLIVGAGGLGSPVAEFLSRAGIGTLGIIDDDRVSLSNLHRQSLYNTSDIGKFKVKIAKDKIKKINNKDRVAQMILTPVIKMELQETDSLPDTLRGKGGFGSTGK